VGHCSGATGLAPLGDREAFSLHPLMSAPTGSGPEVLEGAGCAVDANTQHALDIATTLAHALRMRPAHVAPEDRVAYHAAAEMRAYLQNARAQGRSVGLVPTMGAFHAGHHSLMRAARANQDEVVVSLFVNPAQFNDGADLAAYPRTEQQDAAEAAGVGVDVLF